MRTVFVHDWLVSFRGGEKVLEALTSLSPQSPVYTLFYDSQSMPKTLRQKDIRAPWYLRPFIKIRKGLLPIFPFIVESWPGTKHDFVISTSSCVTKSVKAKKHLCYIHSPMRYIWDQESVYLEPLQKYPLLPFIIRQINKVLRWWDSKTSSRVDQFICNSNFIAKRVKTYYGRDSVVIHPPIESELFEFPFAEKKPYLVAAGALVWYKRFDIAIQACEKLGIDLVIAGNGPYLQELKKLAGPRTTFMSDLNDADFRKVIAEAQALVFPGIEDFGMIAVESMALGTPVIAYKDGGALDFIQDQTGRFFEEPTAESLIGALELFKKEDFSNDSLRAYAKNFSRESFLSKIEVEIAKLKERP
ncbi:glycosyltransferase [Oligoflexaceae bacterium]|nr:glycosyltransferase [Oligoflexaceae bacterium]